MILRPNDLAERWEVSLASIYRMVRSREGPQPFRLSGKLIRFRIADVEAWEARQCALLDEETLAADALEFGMAAKKTQRRA